MEASHAKHTIRSIFLSLKRENRMRKNRTYGSESDATECAILTPILFPKPLQHQCNYSTSTRKYCSEESISTDVELVMGVAKIPVLFVTQELSIKLVLLMIA